jgi:hypothetical protein
MKNRQAAFVAFSIAGMALLSFRAEADEHEKKWYDRLSIKGYTQLRYNRLGNPDGALVTEHDRSVGANQSLFIRRARLTIFGDINDHLYVYMQPDFAGALSASGATQNNFAQIRDWYADIAIDADKEFRIRPGQSKVPFGFETMQSSQNRLAMDRADAINSGVKDERDLGIFAYWAPKEIRARFKHLVESGLKGSGDYGVVGFGVYNGQAGDRPEANDNRHIVGHLAYPYEFTNGQFVEASVHGYTGLYNVATSAGVAGAGDYADQRLAASLVVYPQPIGFQAEYTTGRGPQLNDAHTEIETATLHGGYVQAMYKWETLMPFARWQYYRGGKKHETNAPKNYVNETELGIEWQVIPAVELTGEYTWTDRTSTVAPYRNVADNLIRFQLQWNY